MVLVVVAVVLGSFGLGQGAGPSPSAVPASPGGSAAASSTAPSAAASGAAGDAFPNADEQALLAKITAVPGGFTKACVRGPYEVLTVGNPQHKGRSAAPWPA